MTAISNGGAAQRVKVLTDADLKANGGQYALEGRPPVAVYGVTDAETVAQGGQFVVMGNVAQPVYVVDAPDGVVEGNVPIPMIAVEGGLTLGGPAIPVYVVGGSLGGGLDPVGNLTLEVTGADFDVIAASWDAVTGATEYDVEYSPDGITYTPVDATPLLTYDITDSDYDVDVAIHYVRVRASNGSVDSDWVVVELDGWKINVGFYVKFEETSGNRIDTVQGLVGTDNNTVGSTTGIIGNAAQFVGASSEYLSFANNPAFSIGDGDFTIRAWIRTNTGGASDQWALGKLEEWTLSTREGDSYGFIFRLYNGSGIVASVVSAPTSVNTLYRVVAYRSNDELHLIVDNGTPLMDGIPSPALASVNPLEVGRWNIAGGLYLTGIVDELAVCKGRAWSTDQITQDWNSGAGRTY